MYTYTEFKSIFEDYVQSRHPEKDPAELYDPVNYTMDQSAKRFRPVLLLLGHQMFTRDYAAALPAAYAVEVFHNFSLVHDDIMDKAALRRGSPSVYKKYGVDAAILSGDLMLIKCFEFLIESAEGKKLQNVMREMIRAAIQVCEGQQLDMNFEDRDEISEDEYLQMIEYKTAVLLAASLRIGGIIGGADPQDTEHLYQVGRLLGLAFQIQDDILDVYGDTRDTGKSRAGDIIQRKKTFLYVKSLDILEDDRRRALINLYKSRQSDDSFIEMIMQQFDLADIRNVAIKRQKQYYDQAMAHLNKINVSAELKEPLNEIAEAVFVRSH